MFHGGQIDRRSESNTSIRKDSGDKILTKKMRQRKPHVKKPRARSNKKTIRKTGPRTRGCKGTTGGRSKSTGRQRGSTNQRQLRSKSGTKSRGGSNLGNVARRVNQTTVQLRNKGKFGPVVPISELGDKNVILPVSNLTMPVRERKSKKGDKKPVRRRKKKIVEVDQIR